MFRKRVVFHVDVNAAFLSWEAVYRLWHLGGKTDLRRIPSAVGGDAALRRGIVIAKSIPAKKYGIRTGETLAEARRKCPELWVVPPDYGLYERCSTAFFQILEEYAPSVERYSIDEAFLDMSGWEARWKSPKEAAERLKQHIFQNLGFTVNVGISENKILAKMASDFRKPDQAHTLFPEEIPVKMWPLPVSDLFFVGQATEKKLRRMGIRRIGELAGAPVKLLESHLKKQGRMIWEFANGRDMGEGIFRPPENRGYGNSVTLPFDVTEGREARLVLLSLAETLGRRLRKDKAQAEMISIGIKNTDFQRRSHQRKLKHATDVTEEIYLCAGQLFQEAWNGEPVRWLGISAERAEREIWRQETLFEGEYEKWKKMDQAVDAIRKRYGADAVKRAAFLGSRTDHMSGGVSRERRRAERGSVF